MTVYIDNSIRCRQTANFMLAGLTHWGRACIGLYHDHGSNTRQLDRVLPIIPCAPLKPLATRHWDFRCLVKVTESQKNADDQSLATDLVL